MRRAEHELLRIRSAVAGAQAMEKPPPFESAHCDVCSFTFSTFRRRVRIPLVSISLFIALLI
jgi:hypothetical protein